MNKIKFLESFSLANQETLTGEASKPALNIVVAYEDDLTRQWAFDTYRPVEQLVGAGCIRNTWWKTGTLNQLDILRRAVAAAILADVIIVSVRTAEELPLALYVWIDVWLPRRLLRKGTLMALIGAPDLNGTRSSLAYTYLWAVARKGRLYYQPQERVFPVESSVIFLGKQADRIDPAAKYHAMI